MPIILKCRNMSEAREAYKKKSVRAKLPDACKPVIPDSLVDDELLDAFAKMLARMYRNDIEQGGKQCSR